MEEVISVYIPCHGCGENGWWDIKHRLCDNCRINDGPSQEAQENILKDIDCALRESGMTVYKGVMDSVCIYDPDEVSDDIGQLEVKENIEGESK